MKKLYVIVIAIISCCVFSACQERDTVNPNLETVSEDLETALENRIEEFQEDIASYEEMNQQDQNDLEYYLSDLYLEGEAYKYHFIYPGEKQGN